MAERAELSFVVAAYNAQATLRETLDSILAQDVSVPFEVVVVDDGSTDGTWDVLSTYERSGAVAALRNEENLGGGTARNQAIHRTQGNLLWVVDADNVLPPGTASAVLETLETSGLQAVSVERLVFFESDIGSPTGSWELAHRGYRSGLDELFRTVRVPASHGNYLFARALYEAADGYAAEAGAMETWTFGLRHHLRGYDVAIAPRTHYFHRVGYASYWVREESAGRNDRNAIAALKRELAALPPSVRAKVERLHPSDRLFQYVEAGCLAPEGQLPSRLRRWRDRRDWAKKVRTWQREAQASRRIEEMARRFEQTWSPAYERFDEIVRMRELRCGVEIGVAFGGHLVALLTRTPVERVVGVDPYRNQDGYDDPMNLSQEDFDLVFEHAAARLAQFGRRACLMRQTSLEAARELEGELDFVYLDAAHSREAVALDLEAWYPKVRPGGVLGGHHYGHAQFSGVKQAVDDFCARHGLALQLAGETVWWVERSASVGQAARIA